MEIVAIVSSSGGLDATRRVLAALPADGELAVLVLQHLAPHGPDLLARLLARDSPLPVATARDHDRLRAGEVLVAPAGAHMLVTPGLRVALVPSGASPPPARPSGDLLLTTLALAAGPRATAVILTGHGNDGAEGAAAVRRFGGHVVVSDRATSEVFDMPAATIAAGAADDVLPLPDIGPALAVRSRRTGAAAASG